MLAIALARAAVAGSLAPAGDVPSTQPATTQAAQLPTSRPTAEVLALVNDLTSDKYAVRESAQQKIERLGDAVVPQLRRILDGPLPDEARARIRAAIGHIDQAREFGPSVITLQCHDAPLRNVLEDFAKQADADLGVHRREIQDYLQSRKISLNLNHADFWTALEAVESASGLHARPDNDGRLILDNVGPFSFFGQIGDRSLGCVAGPCLILPQSVNWSMQFGHSSMLYIQFLAVIEPKLHVVGSVQSAWLRECIDDKGHSLLVPSPPGGVFVGPRQWWVPLGANLRVVPGMGRKIARLKGEFDFSVQLKSEPIEVDDLLTAKNVTRSAAGGTITVERCSLENGQYQLHLLISAPPASGIMAFVANPFGSNLRVLDAKDQPLQLISTSRSNNSDGRVMLTLTYIANAGAVGPPKRLKWEVTTEARQLTVPFEFHDLELLHAPDEEGQ
jgi:hypothetical protein